jgi:hypothetical protein
MTAQVAPWFKRQERPVLCIGLCCSHRGSEKSGDVEASRQDTVIVYRRYRRGRE